MADCSGPIPRPHTDISVALKAFDARSTGDVGARTCAGGQSASSSSAGNGGRRRDWSEVAAATNGRTRRAPAGNRVPQIDRVSSVLSRSCANEDVSQKRAENKSREKSRELYIEEVERTASLPCDVHRFGQHVHLPARSQGALAVHAARRRTGGLLPADADLWNSGGREQAASSHHVSR